MLKDLGVQKDGLDEGKPASFSTGIGERQPQRQLVFSDGYGHSVLDWQADSISAGLRHNYSLGS